MMPKKAKCSQCERLATRIVSNVDITGELPNIHWYHIFYRFRRHYLNRGVYMKEFYCERCYLNHFFGLVTFDCEECKRSFVIDYDELNNFFFEDENIFCPFCHKSDFTTSIFNDYVKQVKGNNVFFSKKKRKVKFAGNPCMSTLP